MRKLFILTIALILSCLVAWLALREGSGSLPALLEEPAVEAARPAAPEELAAEEANAKPTPDSTRIESDARAAPLVRASASPFLAGLSGRVEETDGRPVVGIEVSLVEISLQRLSPSRAALWDGGFEPPDVEIAKTRTDQQGRFLLQDARAHELHMIGVGLGSARATLRLMTAALAPGEVGDLGTIVLAPSAFLVGRTIDDDGAPLSGVRVRAVALNEDVNKLGLENLRDGNVVCGFTTEGMMFAQELPSWVARYIDRLPIAATKSGLDGGFRLECAASEDLILFLDRPGRVAARVDELDLLAGEERALGDLVLSRGHKLTAVEDPPSTTKLDVRLGVGVDLDFVGILVGQAQPTQRGADGRYVAEGFPVEAVPFALYRRAAHEPWSFAVGDAGDSVIQLDPPDLGELWIDVVDSAGRSLPEATALISVNDVFAKTFVAALRRQAPRRVERDAQGGLRALDLPHGKYLVHARAPGFAQSEKELEFVSQSERIKLTLEPGKSIEVRVLADATGEPVKGASILVGQSRGEQPPFATTVTDGEGKATLLEVPANPNGANEEFKLRVSHPVFGQHFQPFDPSVDALEIRLGIPGSLDVTLIGASEEDLARGLVVQVTLAVSGGPAFEPDLCWSLVGLDARTRFPSLAPGKYRYVVLSGLKGDIVAELLSMGEPEVKTLGKGRVTIAPGVAEELAIDLTGKSAAKGTGTARVYGVVLVDGAPRAGYSVYVQSLNAVTASDGSFAFEGVSTGNVSLSVSPGGQNDHGPGSRTGLTEFELRDGEARFVQFDLTSIAVRVVRDEDGQPVKRAQVRWSRPNAQRSHDAFIGCDEEGRGELLIAASDLYLLNVYHPSQGSGRTEAQLEFGRAATVEVRLSRGVPCRGQIVIPGVEITVNDYYVLFQGQEQGSFAWSMLQPSGGGGEFEVVGLRAGTYRVSVQGNQVAYREQEVVLDQYGATNLLLEFSKAD